MSLISLFLFVLCVLLAELAATQQGPTEWTASPFNPFSLPLAVRNPYLNTWLPQGTNPSQSGMAVASFWSDSQNTGWFIAIVIDGIAYELAGFAPGIGAVNGYGIQKSVSFSPTNTSFIVQTGPMDVTLTFLSPIEPNDLLRQSLPFSYMFMTAESNDGNAHTVRMYSDVTGEFLLGTPSVNVSWQFDDDGTNIILSEQFVEPLSFSESGDHALDAVEYYCHKKIGGTTTSWQISAALVNRNTATNMNTTLNNTADPGQSLSSDSWPVLGIQIDWGQITSTSEPAVFTLGLIRDPVIQYMLPNNTVQMRSHYYRSSFASDIDALKFFMDDFSRAQQAAQEFDIELRNTGIAISSEYADLLALTARQILSSIDITLSIGSDGNWNFTDTLVFMKNFGRTGSDYPSVKTTNISTQSVNTVDTLFAAFPAFLYLNPELAGYLLAPLLKYQDSPAYKSNFAAKNIGTAYPNATADDINSIHSYGVEETANMLIMILAYSQLSGNNTLIESHFSLLKKWGQYLEDNVGVPGIQQWAEYPVIENNQIIDISDSIQTNLALKGIIAIAAMSKIAAISGNNDDASSFNNTAFSFIHTWQQHALGSSQVNYFYSDEINTGLIYNLYADVLLDLNFVPSNVYSILTTYYDNLTNPKGGYGIPLINSAPELTSVSAMMLSAAAVTNNATRNAMIEQVRNYASSNSSSIPFGVYYDPRSITDYVISQNRQGINSPTIGGIFSVLVKRNFTVRAGGASGSAHDSDTASSKSKARVIPGYVVGGLTGLALIGCSIFLFLRRRQHQARQVKNEDISVVTSSGDRQGSARYGLGRDVIIEPFRYPGEGDLYNDTYSPMDKMSRLQQSLSGVPYVRVPASEKGRLMETRERIRETAIEPNEPVAPSPPRDRNSHVDEENRIGGEVLLAISGSNHVSTDTSARIPAAEEPHPEGVLSSTVLEAIRGEMENLRREVDRIRLGYDNGFEVASEVPPPSYRDD